MRKGRSTLLAVAVFIAFFAGSECLHAEVQQNWVERNFGAIVGVAGDIGEIGNSTAGIPQRTMDALSLEFLPGYKLQNWLLGVDFDYRWEGQITGLSAAGNTNWKGEGWLLGLGAKYRLSPHWALQGAIDFVGDYHFSNATYQSEDDGLKNPLVVRVKGQYFPWKNLPLSFDGDLQFLDFATLRILSVDNNATSTGFFVGVGASWHFGAGPKSEAQQIAVAPEAEVKVEAAPAPSPATAAEVATQQQAALAQVVATKKTDKGLLANFKGDSLFASNSAELSAEGAKTIMNFAKVMAQYPNARVRVEGHADSSGNAAKNQKLSEERAQSVAALLEKAGISKTQMMAQGFGSTRPVADNKTREGRAKNRRVEVYIEN